MSVGDRVRVIISWSAFHGRHGDIAQIDPCVLVMLYGEGRPLRFDADSLAVLG